MDQKKIVAGQGYTKAADRAAVRRLFAEKYGREPDQIHDAGTIWIAGPLPGEEHTRPEQLKMSP